MSSSIRRRSVERRSSVVDDGVDWLHRCGCSWSLLAVGYYAVTVYQVHSTGRSDQARPVDAIVVMGAAQYDGRPSPQLAARLDHAADLWQLGLAAGRGRDRRQPAGRPIHRSRSVGQLPDRSRRAGGRDPAGGGRPQLVRIARGRRRRCCTSAACSGFWWSATRSTHCGSRLIAQELGLVAYVSPTRTSPVRGSRAMTQGAEGGGRNRRRPAHRFQAAAVDHRLNDGCDAIGVGC